MYLLNRHLTFIHIVELQFVDVNTQVTHLDGIRAGKVLHILKYYPLHANVDRFRSTIRDDGSLLVEMAEHLGIIRHFDLERLARTYHRLGIFHSGAVAIWFYAFYLQTANTLVTKFKHGSNGLLETRLANINNRFLCNQFLC